MMQTASKTIESVPETCPPAVSCWWDVNFDCVVNRTDVQDVLAAISVCTFDPCTCDGGDSAMGGSMNSSMPAEPHTLAQFVAAMNAFQPALSAEAIELGIDCWEAVNP